MDARRLSPSSSLLPLFLAFSELLHFPAVSLPYTILMEDTLLLTAIKQFSYYKDLGERTMNQVSDESLFWHPHEESNSIAVIVKHLWGNMLSRWTDFLTSDGEKEWRRRDEEFIGDLTTREEVMEKWNAGWACVFQALEGLTEEDLPHIVYIRNQGHSVTEAILRQLAHYAYHVGQIVYIGKVLAGEKWKSLSIPRNKSSEFNLRTFAAGKRMEHFTDEALKKE